MPGGLMTKKHCCLPPGALDELITRIEDLEKFKEAVEGTIQAAITVYAVRRLPDKPGGDDERRDGEGPIRLDR